MQLLIPYVLNKVAPIHNPSTKVVNFLSMNFCAEQKLEFEDLFHTAFVLLLALKVQNILKINRGKQSPTSPLLFCPRSDRLAAKGKKAYRLLSFC